MPVLNGLDAARMIRKISPQTPVLIVTMHKTKQLLEEARPIGVRGYVAQAEMGHTLAQAVNAVLENQPFFPVENS
jgi:DNA-binding NarL/FixJ family response regulator